MLEFLKLSLVISLSIAISSCSHSASHHKDFLSENYQAAVSGLYLDLYKDDLCEMSVSLTDIEPIEILEYTWTKRDSLGFLLTGIQSKPITKMRIASPQLCKADTSDHLKESLSSQFAVLKYGPVRSYQKLNEDPLLKSSNLFHIDLSFKDIDERCAIIRKKPLYLDFRSSFEIRYSLAIPLLYYNFSDDNELFVFDSQCDEKRTFIRLIDKFYRKK